MVVFGGLGMKLCASVLRSWRIPRFFSSKFAITVYTKLAAVILLGDVRGPSEKFEFDQTNVTA